MVKSAQNSPTLIKYLIWLYLFLLVFEGALRKWMLPAFSDPLLIIRDPLALLIYVVAYQKIPKSVINPYTITVIVIGCISFATTLALGHGNMFVSVFGLRTLILHIPIIFVIAYHLDREDVIQIGKAFLLISIPMTLLLILQFNTPQSSFVNRAPGGTYGASITGALGKYRPPGTFSFITGVVQFYTLCIGFLMSHFLERKYLPMWIAAIVSGALLIAIPISISRTLMLNTAIVAILAFYGVYRAGGSMKFVIRFVVVGAIGFAVATQFDSFDEAIEASSARWENSTGEQQGGFQEAIVERFFGELTRPLRNISSAKFFGEGIGIGTQAGAKLLTGERGFLVGEGEWERLIFEMGALLGLIVIAYRVILTYKLASMAHKTLGQQNLLPWLMFATSALLVFNGQWGQPTTLGFTMVGAGFTLAAMKKKQQPKPSAKSNLQSSQPKPPPPPPPGSRKQRALA